MTLTARSRLPVTVAHVEAAAARIADSVEPTPSANSLTLSEITGADVVVKFENFQFTGSFKERGARNRLELLTAHERARGVIAVSAGNHGQGVAHHAGELGIPATVVVAEGTPFIKVARTEAMGTRVIQHGATFADAHRHAVALAEAEGLLFVSPYDDPAVIAGQGTIALELLSAHPDLDALLVPVGGGGLLSGIAIVARERAPDMELIGVQAAGCASMVAALAGEPQPSRCQTIADGIAVPKAGKLTTEIVGALADDVVTVAEEHIEAAISLYLDVEKVVAEGAGAVSLAALLKYPDRFRGRRVGLVLSGGNIDPSLLASVITRSLARTGRLTHLLVEISDTPGSLARVTAVVARFGANIVDVVHRRDMPAIGLKGARLELVIETRDREHATRIVEALEAEGYPVTVERPV